MTGVTIKASDGGEAPTALAANATVQLKAEAAWSDGTKADVTAQATWTSKDTAKATVSSGGLVTWVAEGVARISAAYQGKTSADASIACAAAPAPPSGE